MISFDRLATLLSVEGDTAQVQLGMMRMAVGLSFSRGAQAGLHAWEKGTGYLSTPSSVRRIRLAPAPAR